MIRHAVEIENHMNKIYSISIVFVNKKKEEKMNHPHIKQNINETTSFYRSIKTDYNTISSKVYINLIYHLYYYYYIFQNYS